MPSPFDMITHSPIMQLANLARAGQNPMGLIQQLGGQSAPIMQGLNLIQGKNESQLRTMAQNLAKERGIENIKGHRSVGGMRASIYNAMPIEGVEKLVGNGAVTKGQRELIQKLLTDFPDAVELFEYEDYCKTPTLGTASAFITMALDANLHEIDSESGYMQYIATRPRVQKRGTHGLFSSATAVDLASAMSELEAHEGNVWTIIYSLRREDAARLEYDNADAWRTLLMENAPTLAKSMKISLDSFHWYAAFHDEGHHPHIHMMVWSDDPKEGFLTKDGIAAMRSKLTNAIFRDEMQQIYARKDVAYSDLVEAAQNAMREMISRMQRQVCDSPIIEDNMHQLVQALETTTGKKQYGYLKKPLKQLVDTIVDALAELPEAEKIAFCKTLDTIYRRSKQESRAGFPHITALTEQGEGECHE